MKLRKDSFGNITTGSAGDHSIPLAARLPGATALPTATASPLMVIARMGRKLDQQYVDSAGRWLVVDPVFVELLKDEDSRLLNSDFGGAGLQERSGDWSTAWLRRLRFKQLAIRRYWPRYHRYCKPEH